MPKLLDAQEDAGIKRKRTRLESLKFDKKEIADRIYRFYTDDNVARSEDIESRLQRHAKLRMWTEGTDWPWEDASDIGLPDMMTNSLRIQDTLHNAVMAIRPAIVTKAISGKADVDKQQKIDNLIDFQVFVEQQGEKFIGDCADAFTNDGVFHVFTAWVREDREVMDVRFYPPIPDEGVPVAYFKEIVVSEFSKIGDIRKINDGWDWEIDDPKEKEPVKASFYTRDDDKVELVIRKTVRIFDGPKLRVMDYEDVLYPSRAENLQIPGPANPSGAAHVILCDYPTVDEIRRHKKSGFYNLMTDEDLLAIENASQDRSYSQEVKQQKDDFQGTHDLEEKVKSHKSLTRVLCFDLYDIDGDGVDEDIVWWMILETKTVVKAKHLTEMWPGNPPYRPIGGAAFIPVRGRVSGIGIPELTESTHDVLKSVFDQTLDAGTLANVPFGFYRASSNVKPEVMRMWPGELYPLGDPQRDIHFPQMPQTSQAFGLNMMTVLGQFQDKLTMQGELQFGRIPKGQASAFRSAEAQQTLLAQGEARPERILRRFFMGLTQVWSHIHQLNQRFLPEKKKYMVAGYLKPEDDPYEEINTTKEIEGNFQFDFRANVFNTSKEILQSSMQQLMGTLMNPLMVQLGLVTPDNIYQMVRDYSKSLGQDAEYKYITPPSPESSEPPIVVEEAIHSIMLGDTPKGRPAEGAQVHFQKLTEFMQSDDFGYLDNPQKVMIFKSYFLKVRDAVQKEIQLQQLSQQVGTVAGKPNGGSAGVAPAQANPPVGKNELIDETLPSAR